MELPARFGRYVLERRIGQGGMAEVFRARIDDGFFQKTVCIKRILPELSSASGFADMLRDEARLAGRFTHANLVQTIDFGEIDGSLYIAMELVDGASLAGVMRSLRQRRVPFPIPAALQIAVAMCRGLHHAHTAAVDGRPLGFVHRDVSPQNVLLGRDGAIKISDFGIASARNRITRTETGAIKGKPQYMAPEQVSGERTDHRLDQFATGIVLWEMLSGRGLFRQPSVLLILDAVCRADIPDVTTARGDVSPPLAEILRRALALHPDDRFPTMAAFEAALTAELARMGASPDELDVRPLVEQAGEFPPLDSIPDAAPVDEARTEVDVGPGSGPARRGADGSDPTVHARAQGSRPSRPSRGDLASAPTQVASRGRTPAAGPVVSRGHTEGPAVTTPSTHAARPVLPRDNTRRVVVGLVAVSLLAVFSLFEIVVVKRAPPDTAPRHRTMPQTAAALDMAEAALARGDPTAAVTALSSFSSLPEPDVHRVLGLAYARLEETELSKLHYRRYLELAPDARDAKEIEKLAR